MKVTNYQHEQPPFVFEEYFSGPLSAWGMLEGPGGKVLRRFDIAMQGSWQGDAGELLENFTYYDGEKQQRRWAVTRLGGGRYQGTAGDIAGTAQGQTSGNAMRWHYDMVLKISGLSLKIRFDDWMFLMSDGVLINRSALKKFGITLARLTIFMRKLPA